MSIIELLEKDVNDLMEIFNNVRICKVQAYKYGKTHISFKCPYCRTKYKKNGEPTKMSKSVYHHHGSMERYPNNFITNRAPHCIGVGRDRFDKSGYTSFDIHITDDTIREENY